MKNPHTAAGHTQTKGKKHVGVLLYPDCVALDLVGPIEALNYATMITAEETGVDTQGYKITLLADKAGPVRSMSGVQLYADQSYLNFDAPLDTLLVPGMKVGSVAYKSVPLIEWIQKQASTCRRLASVCSGAYVFACAGLLDGKKITTHWNHGEKLQRTYPEIEVDHNQIYCKSGNIYSSAGVTAGIDLTLALIEEDFGKELALKIAKRMVVFLKRPGDQAQFSDLLNAQSQSTRFSGLLDWLETNLSKDLTMSVLADHCAMSARNFSRAFKADMDLSPMQYVKLRRLEYARLMLEETDKPLATIARLSGFLSAERLTRAFRTAYHITPTDYRQRFR